MSLLVLAAVGERDDARPWTLPAATGLLPSSLRTLDEAGLRAIVFDEEEGLASGWLEPPAAPPPDAPPPPSTTTADGAAPPRTASSEALAYQYAVVRALWRHVDPILPARFGEVFADEAELRALLRRRASALLAGLAKVRGRDQMTLRVVVDTPPKGGHAPAVSAAMAAAVAAVGGPGEALVEELVDDPARPGASYLARKRQLLDEERLAVLDPLRRALGALVVEERVSPAQGLVPPSVHHLVARADVEAYRSVASSWPGPVEVTVRGPFPPFAFAEGL